MSDQKTKAAAGSGYAGPAGSALIRTCDGCGSVRAIDMENTIQHKREMQMIGQTVHEVSRDEALAALRADKPCTCKKPNTERSGGLPSDGADGSALGDV